MKVAQIDIGYAHCGLCIGETRATDKTMPYLEQSTLLITADGKVYRYQESIAGELVRQWLQDHWGMLYNCDLVVLEKQKTDMLRMQERACIYIEATFYGILDSYHRLGVGPRVVIMSPMWWRTVTGVHNRETQGTLGDVEAYEARKETSVEAFKRHCGVEQWDKLVDLYGLTVTDCIEAYWGWYAVKTDPKSVEEKLETQLHHSYLIGDVEKPVTDETLQRRITKREREEPVESLQTASIRPKRMCLSPANKLHKYDQLQLMLKREKTTTNTKKRLKMDEEKANGTFQPKKKRSKKVINLT